MHHRLLLLFFLRDELFGLVCAVFLLGHPGSLFVHQWVVLSGEVANPHRSNCTLPRVGKDVKQQTVGVGQLFRNVGQNVVSSERGVRTWCQNVRTK